MLLASVRTVELETEELISFFAMGKRCLCALRMPAVKQPTIFHTKILNQMIIMKKINKYEYIRIENDFELISHKSKVGQAVKGTLGEVWSFGETVGGVG